jgi:membrane associated rhomboid family serine protease
MGLSLERVIGLYCLIAGSLYIGAALRSRPTTTELAFAPATVMTAALLVAGLALQLSFPALVTWTERNAAAIGRGEIWRLVTALFFQDRGTPVPGGLFNLMALILVGSAAERLWGSARWLLIYFGCGVLGECLAWTWQPIGSGNSIATLGLSGALLMRGLLTPQFWVGRIIGLLGAVIGLGLLAKHDIHGTAVMLGMAAGAVCKPTQGR